MKLETTVTLDAENKVTCVGIRSVAGVTVATPSEADPDLYEYASELDGDTTPVMSEKLMTLADVILAAYVHHGVIPPQSFETIPCSSKH